MAYNGSGQFNRLYNWQQDSANGINIVPDRHDNEDDGFATGLSNCLTKDGQQVATANQPMGGFKHTNVADASARNQYASLGQVQDNAYAHATAGGSSNAYTLTLSPAVPAYTAGQKFTFVANFLSTGAATLNVNSLGAKNIKVEGLYDLPAYAIKNGQLVEVVYDGTSFQPVNLGHTTGDVIHYSASTKAGWLYINGTTTVGSVSSGADNASAAMEGMYRHIYDNYDDAEAPVSGGRGASAAADFAANKKLTLPNFKDASIYGIGSTLTKAGKLSGAATVTPTGTVGTSGAHTLTTSEVPNLSVPIGTNAVSTGGGGTFYGPAGTGGNTSSSLATNTGGGGSHTHAGGTLTMNASSVLHPVVGLYPLMKI